MPLFYGYDPYIILLIPALIISIWAQFKVKSSFTKYSKVASPLTGEQAALAVLKANGVTGVSIQRVSGSLSDHYDPRNNVIRLSDDVFDSRSIAAVGVAAHEAGHAVQYAKHYFPIKIRATILPISQIGSQLSMPLILMGIIFTFNALIDIGIIFFCAALAFQLITLPVEFNASRRAINTIKSQCLLSSDGDVRGVRKVLSAAAMTYVAAVIVSLMQLIRLLAITKRRD